MTHSVVAQALELLACEVRESNVLTDPSTVKDYLRLKLADRPHEVFVVVFLDAQYRVIDTVEMFRGKLTQTSVYPKEVVVDALERNATQRGSGHLVPQPRQRLRHTVKGRRKADPNSEVGTSTGRYSRVGSLHND
jgi:DNA repair protein RadC